MWFKKRIFADYAGSRDNPSSIYKEGVEAKRKLEDARTRIARVLGVQARDIIFTSGGTESDNLAVLGSFAPGAHIVISDLEHPAIREAAKEFERRGGDVSVVQSENGVVHADKVAQALRPNTVLVSIMYANNETGAIQPISKIAKLVNAERKRRGGAYPYMHTDASQAINFLPLRVSALGVTLMTLDASKAEGPKSIGLLVVRPGANLHPIMFGGGQERGLRPGTENVSAAVEFANALERAEECRESESARLAKLKHKFVTQLKSELPNLVINTPDESLPHIVSVTFPGQLHEFIAIKLDEAGIAVSTGSSCSTRANEADKEAIRFSFGHDTREHDIEEIIRVLKKM